MLLTIPNKIRWRREIDSDLLSQYSKRQRRSLRNTIEGFGSNPDLRFEILDLDEQLTDWFSKRYELFISAKKNPVLHNVADTTLNNPEGGVYKILIFYEADEATGGMIFSIRDNRINLVYKVFEYDWKQVALSAGPALYADYLLAEYASDLGKQYLSHGMDRNMYGLHTDIGLAVFKLSVNCKASLPNKVEFITIDTEQIQDDTLILHSPLEGTSEITEGTLFCSKENYTKYERLAKYPEQLAIKILYRD